MKKAASLIILLFSLTLPAWCATGNGGQPGNYLTGLSGGARGQALGLAQVSMEGQANLLYSNPASIAGLYREEASFSYMPLLDQSQFATVSFAAPVGNGCALGANLSRLSSGDAEKTSALGETIGTFSDQETAVIIGAAANLSREVALGVSMKAVSQEIDTLSQKGVGADIGLIYRYAPGHTWGFSLVNVVAPTLGPDTFPLTLEGGFSHTLFKDFCWHGEMAMLNVFKNELISRWYTGFEFNRPGWLFWRLGANEKQYSAGFGIGTKQIDIDYAFISHPMETLHNVSLNIRYGFPATEAEVRAQERIAEMEQAKRELDENTRKQNENIKFERERLEREKKLAVEFIDAKKAFEEKRYAYAQEKLKQILGVDPSYDEAKKLLDEIKSRLNSENIVRRLQYAKDAYKKGSFTEAKEHIEFVLELQPDNLDARVLGYLTNAQIYLAGKQYNSAKGELIEVLKIEPNNPEASQLLKRVQNILDVYGGQ